MLIRSAWPPYQKGMLLEAEMLNRDFSLTRFLVGECALADICDGIVSGMAVITRGGALFLQKGVFRINGRMGWLLDEMRLEMPPKKQTSFLCLLEDGENTWRLEWKTDPGEGITLCRTTLFDPAMLRNSFHLSPESITSLEKWQTYLNAPDYIQLEYAMAASRGSKATLVPGLQRALAPFAKPPELRIWLINGLLPFMDYFAAGSWQEGLDKLLESFTEGEAKAVSCPPRRRSILSK